MKKQNFELTSSDVEALMFTLSLTPLTEEFCNSETQMEINVTNSVSAMEKLALLHDDFTPNELRVMGASLQFANAILRGEIIVNSETKRTCSKYLFTIQKLLPIFDSAFDSSAV